MTEVDEEMAMVCHYLQFSLDLRKKYLYVPALPALPEKINGPFIFDPTTVTIDPASPVCALYRPQGWVSSA